jgi:hypothetical protein
MPGDGVASPPGEAEESQVSAPVSPPVSEPTAPSPSEVTSTDEAASPSAAETAASATGRVVEVEGPGCSPAVPEAIRCWSLDGATPLASDALTDVRPVTIIGKPGWEGGADESTLLSTGEMVAVSWEPPADILRPAIAQQIGLFRDGAFEPLVDVEPFLHRGVGNLVREGEDLVWAEGMEVGVKDDWLVRGLIDGQVMTLLAMADFDKQFTWENTTIQDVALTDRTIYASVRGDTKIQGRKHDSVIISTSRQEPGPWETVVSSADDFFIPDGTGAYYLAIPSEGEAGTALDLMRLTGDPAKPLEPIDTLTVPVGWLSSSYDMAMSDRYVAWGLTNRTEQCSTWSDSSTPIGPGGCESWIAIKDKQDGTITALQLKSDGVEGPSLSGHYLAWGIGGGMGDPGVYLVNLKTGAANTLGTCENCGSATVAYPAVVWTSQTDPSGTRREELVNYLGFLRE